MSGVATFLVASRCHTGYFTLEALVNPAVIFEIERCIKFALCLINFADPSVYSSFAVNLSSYNFPSRIMNSSTGINYPNGTSQLPIGILNALIGYNPLLPMISNHIDLTSGPISFMLIVLILIVYVSRTGHLQQYFWTYFSSSVRVNEDDELFVLISDYVSTQLSGSGSIRHLIARFMAEDPVENLGSPSNSQRAISYTPVYYCSFKYEKYVFRATFQAEITGDTKLKYIQIWTYNGISMSNPQLQASLV